MPVRLCLVAALLLALCLTGSSQAEIAQEGNLRASFDGQMTPKRLPRHTPAPVAVRVAGDFKALAGTSLPQLRTISIAINSAGVLDDAGLPICRVESIEPATETAAHRICGRAIVGSGHVSLEIHLENQSPFSVEGHLLAFNGPIKRGRKLILAQVYARDPPGAFVLTFKLKKRPGVFGTVMSTSLPPSARGWAYLTHFDMTLNRRYRYRGKSHSYVSAACSAPAGFPGAPFPFASARYGFAGGQTLKTTVVRNCKVRG
jgi:hypothetical protein